MNPIPIVNAGPMLALLFLLGTSLHIWRMDPGLATLTPESLGKPLTPQQALRHYCGKCRIVRLPGVKHCNFCHVCIKEYDHHCGVVGKCSGKNSYFPMQVWICANAALWVCLAVCGFGIVFNIVAENLLRSYFGPKKL